MLSVFRLLINGTKFDIIICSIFITSNFNISRKNMETEITKEQLMQIIDALNIGVIYTDVDGNMLFINEMAEEIREITRSDKLGTNVINCHAPHGRSRVKKLLQEFKDGTVEHRHRLVRIKGKYFDNKYLVVRGEDSRPSGMILMSQDVTEKIQLKEKLDEHYRTVEDEIEKKSKEIEARYEELIKLQQRLMHSEKMSSVGQFVSIVAHEVNNPLDGIKNCLHAIQDEPEKLEQTKKYSALALEALTKIEEVTRLILNYARPDNYYMEEIEINSIIEESVRFTRYRLERNNIPIETDYVNELAVNGSKQHLVQVFVNLIMNSIDAINEKRSITLNRQKKNGDSDVIRISVEDSSECVCVKVTDTGCGISTKDTKQLFRPFYTTKKDQGTGLGLYICFNIIYIHNGKISVDSTSGIGTSFTIHIPKYSHRDNEKSMDKVSKLKEKVLQGYIEQ